MKAVPIEGGKWIVVYQGIADSRGLIHSGMEHTVSFDDLTFKQQDQIRSLKSSSKAV